MEIKNNPRSWIILLSAFAILVTLWLVYSELRIPGHCLPYPVIEIPACYAVLLFFSLVLGSQFVGNKNISTALFYSGSIAGLATAIWFSLNQLMGTAHCPVLFSVPLCFVAFATFLTLIVLNQIKKRARTSLR